MPRSLIAAALLGVIAMPAMATVPAATPNAWLVGDWMLCKDPDKSAKDTLRFEPDGTGWVLREKGNIETVYRVREQRVELLANANGRAIPITLTFTATRDVLQLHSDKTGSDSTYVRKDGKRVGECDA
ncbi:hypothetical protein [Pseudoxanthomonas japonensis]|uniref:Uncharacterized protein n=1 Tax=Pseudoxanthomonas japonensis TaxID=69284 RepID=A0ABQ6ZHV0_9GAMM|nr:hypothetical protein [Pseudoxanthomonas japonensis]KAF1725493.1 hypothetical protein CSC78_08490 [Pseudoxanthomonas japonensis]